MPKENKGQGKLDIFKHREKIEKRIEEGYSLKPIYNELEEDLAISYRQFLRLVNKYILGKDSKSVNSSSTCKTPKSPNIPVNPKSKFETKSFVHNPSIDEDRMKELFGE